MKKLTGKQKAAVLLLSMGDNLSTQIIKQMNEEEVEQIFLEIANLGKVSHDLMEQVSQEFYELCLANNYINSGGVDYARALLEKALGVDKANSIINRLASSLNVRPFDFMRRTDPAQLLNFIQDEHPQTIALILAQLDAEQSAAIISGLPPEKQAEVAYRVALMDSTSPGIIKEVEHVLERKLSTVVSRDYTRAGGIKSVVDILNRVDRSTEKTIIDMMEGQDPELAEQVKKLLFVFEDIVQLDDRAVQTILHEVEIHDLALALKGATANVYGKVEKNISKRAAENLKDEIEFMGPVRIRDVEVAQQNIVVVIRKLEEQGQIMISRGEEDQIIS